MSRLGHCSDGREMWAGYIFYALAPLFIFASPVFIGIMADRLHLTPAQMGGLAAIEATGGIFASVTAPHWIARVPWRPLAFWAAAVAVIGALLGITATSFEQLLVIRLTSSILGCGVLYAIGVAILARTAKPDRHFAIAGGLQAAVPALTMFLVPWAAKVSGSNLALGVFAAAFACSLLGIRFMRMSTEADLERTVDLRMRTSAFGLQGLAILGSTLCLAAASGAYWSFAERIGVQAALSADAIGAVLAVASIAGVGGSALAVFLIGKASRSVLFAFGSIGYLAALAMLHARITLPLYATTAVLSYICSVFLTPLQFGAIAQLDHEGKLAVAAPAAQSLGVMAGPFAAGLAIRGNDFVVSAVVAGAFAILTWILFVISTTTRVRVRHAQARSTHG